MGNKVWQSAVTSDDHWGFWSLDWEMKQCSALSKVFSRCCFPPSPCLLLHRSTFPFSPSSSLSAVCFVAYPPLLTLFLFMRCICFILQLHPAEASQLMHHSRCLLAAWMREKSVWPAIGRVSLLSDTDAWEWSKSQNSAVADCSQTSVCIKPPKLRWNEVPSSSLPLSKLNNLRIVTDHLSSSESQQGRSQSKYVMNRQPHQCDWYSLFCLDAMFNT